MDVCGNIILTLMILLMILTIIGYDIVVVGVQECEYTARAPHETCEADWFRYVVMVAVVLVVFYVVVIVNYWGI